MSKSAMAVTLGLMTWGAPEENSRVTDLKVCEGMLDVLQAHGHNEVDTAIIYNGGTSEKYLGKLDWLKRGIVVDTKLFPLKDFKLGSISHTDADIRKWFKIQLESINAKSFDMWYLHGPDRTVPYEETLATVNALHKEGLFRRFGISNYMAWEVAEIVGICEKNGWIKPCAYQGIYNAIHRNVEPELFPCLRKFGMSFYEFNSLGGGFFTGRINRDEEVEEGSRFDPKKAQGRNYRNRYWKDQYFDAKDMLKPVVKKHKLTLAETAMRWVTHHSMMRKELGDNVLIGASSVSQLEANLVDLEKGPLPEEVVKALDVAWDMCKAISTNYFR